MNTKAEIQELGQGFVAGGVDPFGTRAPLEARKAVAQDVKGQSLKRRQLAVAAGSAVGGAIILPAVLGAVFQGLKGTATTPGGAKAKLVGAGRAALVGLRRPLRQAVDARRLKSVLSRAARSSEGAALSSRESASLERIIGTVPLGTVLKGVGGDMGLTTGSALGRHIGRQVDRATANVARDAVRAAQRAAIETPGAATQLAGAAAGSFSAKHLPTFSGWAAKLRGTAPRQFADLPVAQNVRRAAEQQAVASALKESRNLLGNLTSVRVLSQDVAKELREPVRRALRDSAAQAAIGGALGAAGGYLRYDQGIQLQKELDKRETEVLSALRSERKAQRKLREVQGLMGVSKTADMQPLAPFTQELFKLAVAAPSAVRTSNVAQDVAAGVDPFGTWTSQYGQSAQRAGLTEAQHSRKRMAGVAGGLVGGAVVVPSAISGLVGGAQGFARGRGLGGALAGAGRGFMRGTTKPWRMISHGGRATRFLGRAAAGTKAVMPSAAQRSSLAEMVGSSPLPTKILREHPRLAAVLAEKGQRMAVTPEVAKMLHAPASSQYVSGLSQLGLGGTIGAGGAYVQYGKGRQAEKGFQARLQRIQAQQT